MVKVCSVRWCKNTSRSDSKGRAPHPGHFFKYPSEEGIRAKWSQFCNSWMPVDDWEPSQYSFVCSDHFQSDDIVLVGNTYRLKENAVPGDTISLTGLQYLQS